MNVIASLRRLGAGPWSSLRVLALLVAALGAYGIVSGILDLTKAAPPSMPRRLEPMQVLESLTGDYPANFATVLIFSLFMLLLSVHFFAILKELYPRAPLASLLAGLFLGGSVLFGMVLGLTALKVNEFALQVAAGSTQQQEWFTSEQQEWLRDGINFLNQIHLIFVWGWLLCLGLGWMFVGWGVLSGLAGVRVAGGAELLAGLAVVTGVMFELWEPTYAGNPPPIALLFIRQLQIAIALGLLASGVLAWSLTRHSQHEYVR